MQEPSSENEINLGGSTALVVEFFGYAVNSILFQRGIYPPESFRKVSKYGLTLLVSSNDELTAYIGQILTQVTDWLLQGDVQKLILAVTGSASNQVLERWVFNVGGSATRRENLRPSQELRSTKPEKEIAAEIQAIMKQISASVSWLPLLQEPATIDLLVYAPKDVKNVPNTWEDSDPKLIPEGEEVELRSFSTNLHKISGAVRYKVVGV